jgi:hypothetical protein
MDITKSASKGGENSDAVKYFVEEVPGLYVAVDPKNDRGQTVDLSGRIGQGHQNVSRMGLYLEPNARDSSTAGIYGADGHRRPSQCPYCSR